MFSYILKFFLKDLVQEPNEKGVFTSLIFDGIWIDKNHQVSQVARNIHQNNTFPPLTKQVDQITHFPFGFILLTFPPLTVQTDCEWALEF